MRIKQEMQCLGSAGSDERPVACGWMEELELDRVAYRLVLVRNVDTSASKTSRAAQGGSAKVAAALVDGGVRLE